MMYNKFMLKHTTTIGLHVLGIGIGLALYATTTCAQQKPFVSSNPQVSISHSAVQAHEEQRKQAEEKTIQDFEKQLKANKSITSAVATLTGKLKAFLKSHSEEKNKFLQQHNKQD